MRTRKKNNFFSFLSSRLGRRNPYQRSVAVPSKHLWEMARNIFKLSVPRSQMDCGKICIIKLDSYIYWPVGVGQDQPCCVQGWDIISIFNPQTIWCLFTSKIGFSTASSKKETARRLKFASLSKASVLEVHPLAPNGEFHVGHFIFPCFRTSEKAKPKSGIQTRRNGDRIRRSTRDGIQLWVYHVG